MAEYFDVTTDYLLRGIEPARERKGRADARTLCIVSTAVNAVGLIIGAALWRTYQNAFAPAFILSAQAAGLVLWLLAKGGRPRWYWAANVWLLGVLPSYWLGEPWAHGAVPTPSGRPHEAADYRRARHTPRHSRRHRDAPGAEKK